MKKKKFKKARVDRETAEEMKVSAKTAWGLAGVAEMLAILRAEEPRR